MPSKSNKRYYWLKLHEEFFNQQALKYIRRLPEGEKITIIYLKLLLMSLKTDGYIYLEGLYPTIEEEIALALDEELMSVQFSLAALEKAGLLERGDSDDWEVYMTKIPEMTGIWSETASTQRSRISRARKAGLLEDKNSQGVALQHGCSKMQQKCITEKEIEKETETDTEKERESDGSGPHFYGVNRNVILSDAEYESLKKLYPDYLGKIDYFSAYMANTGKQYENHYLTILQWAKYDEQKCPRAEPKNSGFPDYSFKKGESY